MRFPSRAERLIQRCRVQSDSLLSGLANLARGSAMSEVSYCALVLLTFCLSRSSPISPIFFCLPLHRRRFRVLHLQPIGRAAGAIGRTDALRDDAFEAELTGVAEDDVAGLSDMFVELQANLGSPT